MTVEVELHTEPRHVRVEEPAALAHPGRADGRGGVLAERRVPFVRRGADAELMQHASSWAVAAPSTGPSQLCHTTPADQDSASVAILRQPLIPPASPTSARANGDPPCAKSSLTSCAALGSFHSA